MRSADKKERRDAPQRCQRQQKCMSEVDERELRTRIRARHKNEQKQHD